MRIFFLRIVLPLLIFFLPLTVITTPPDFTAAQQFAPYPLAPSGDINALSASSKYNVPSATTWTSMNSFIGFMRNAAAPTHPSISFSQSSLLNTFLTNISNDDNNYFLTYFGKLHLIILHELYIYLMKVYTTFNLTNVDIWSYLETESTQALNTKTLIINHLINIIEAQINQKVLSYFPGLPQNSASRISGMFINNDFGSSLQLLIDGTEETLFANMQESADAAGNTQLSDQITQVKGTIATTRDSYIGHLADYLKLFDAYTDPLYNSSGTIDIDSFVADAQSIQSQIQTPVGPQSGSSLQTQMSTLRSMQKINPPLFFYDTETMRGLKLIPALAQRIPEGTVSVPWPSQIVAAAKSGDFLKTSFGNVLSANPLAFYANNDGTILGASEGPRLFINIYNVSGGSLTYIYQQELLAQPEWLNSTKGIMYMLRACLGDFSTLLDTEFSGQYILDPCITCILQNAASVAGTISSVSQSVCDECQNYLDELAALAEANLADTEAPYVPPIISTDDDDSGVSTSPGGP